MKVVLVDPDIRVPGTKIGTEDTIIDPETDILSDDGGQDPAEFEEGEQVEIRFVDSQFSTSGVVTKLHPDEGGTLVQVRINWDTVVPFTNG